MNLVCRCEGVYSGALTYGKSYEVRAADSQKGQFRVTGDNHRTRWFPQYCFCDHQVPTIETWNMDDPAETFGVIDVTLTLSDGSRRTWSLVTLQRLEQILDSESHIPGDGLLVVKSLDPAYIHSVLDEKQRAGDLLEWR